MDFRARIAAVLVAVAALAAGPSRALADAPTGTPSAAARAAAQRSTAKPAAARTALPTPAAAEHAAGEAPLHDAAASSVHAAAPSSRTSIASSSAVRRASAQAAGAHEIAGERAISPPVRDVLVEKLGRLGVDVHDPRALDRLMRLGLSLSDGAVGELRAQVLTDPRYSADVRNALMRISDQALAGGVKTVEAKAMRLELLAMAIPESTRKPLLDAIHTELGRAAIHLGSALDNGSAVRFRQVVVGGGPQGQTIANELHEVGEGHSTLVVDAGFGDGNFGSIRKFDLNSSNGVYDGVHAETAAGRSQNPLHGSPVQVSDLDDRPFPNAGALGDAATIGLYAAMRRGTNVLVETHVTGIARSSGPGWPAKYRIDMTRNGKPLSVYTDRVILAAGLGKASLPKDPSTRAFAQVEMDKLTKGPEGFREARIVTGEELLRAANKVQDEAAFYASANGPIYFIGGGDAGKTAVEHFGTATKAGARPPAYWVGVDPEKLVKRYEPAGAVVRSGAIVPTTGRLTKIEPIPGSTRLRLTFETAEGPVTKEAGKVVLNMGMESDLPSVLHGVAKDFDPSKHLIPVVGVDPHFVDQALGKQLVVQGAKEDVYVVGVASGLERPKGTSFLQYFGWKNVQFVDQVLAKGSRRATASVPLRRVLALPAPTAEAR